MRTRLPFLLLLALALALPPSLLASDGADPTPKPSIQKRITVVGDAPGDVRTIVVNGDDEEEGEGNAFAYSFDFDTALGRGYLGVGLLNLNRELRAHFGVPQDAGVMVSSVDKDSPAAKTGLAVGDIITAIDGKPVRDSWAIGRAVRSKKSGDAIAIDVWHNGRAGKVTATAAEREHQKVEVMPFPAEEAMRHAREAVRDSQRVREEVMEKLHRDLADERGQSHLMMLRSEREAELEKRLADLEKKLDELQKKLDKNNSK